MGVEAGKDWEKELVCGALHMHLNHCSDCNWRVLWHSMHSLGHANPFL